MIPVRIALVALCLFMPVAAIAQAGNDAQAKVIEQASIMLATGKPADAIKTVDPLLANAESQYKNETKELFCASSQAEAVAMLASASKTGKATKILNMNWCSALFIKGFAMVDLHDPAQAEIYLRRAAEMAPLNAHFINEYAELHKAQRDWQGAYALFGKAAAATQFSPPAVKAAHLGRALRGMGFTLIEMGKLDEAEARFNEALKLNPNDAVAKGELGYIRQLRART